MLGKETLAAIAIVLAKAMEKPEILLDPSDTTAGFDLFLSRVRYGQATIDTLLSGEAIADIWSIEDVYAIREDEETFSESDRPTEAEAREVLKRADNSFNAEVGINWDVLRTILDDVISEREVKVEV